MLVRAQIHTTTNIFFKELIKMSFKQNISFLKKLNFSLQYTNYRCTIKTFNSCIEKVF